MFKVSITAMLNAFSAWWHMIGVAVHRRRPDHRPGPPPVGRLRLRRDDQQHRASAEERRRGLVFFYVFLTGLLMAQYTITGYDASAHMSEETRQASRSARAWGMVMSVVVSVIFGFILLVAVTFAVPSDTGRARRPATYVVTYIWQTSMSTDWAEFLLFIAVVAQFFCTIASTTSASRMMFAFSRDGAVPGPPALEAGLEARPHPGLHGLGDRRARVPDAAAGAGGTATSATRRRPRSR